MQIQQQPPNTPPMYIEHTNRGLPNHTIILLFITYMPNTTHTMQLATQLQHNLWLIPASKILEMDGWRGDCFLGEVTIRILETT